MADYIKADFATGEDIAIVTFDKEEHHFEVELRPKEGKIEVYYRNRSNRESREEEFVVDAVTVLYWKASAGLTERWE